ncbi:murein biosynthesis integral membrane protein MurJ [Fusibacter tunisiensis]|uniref:Lipid II flippase n=1 Tax=Fusibacter tunisiensis TaxID=1008308 RepID=A0ABS2MST9_9FIRM|nr:murein biosynthesis integral membrane protein MurJ [Fusibacter tunisiensis]MBM7562470.1 putative peptidoglycan lipid II flippase [Fusibacter tunisiensis]
MMKKENKDYIVLMAMILTTLLSKMLGMVRDMLIAGDYGITYEADAFFIASRIPNNFFDFALSAAVVSTFIPIFNRTIHQKSEKEAFQYANHFLTFALILSGAVAFVLLILPEPLVSIFGPGLGVEASKLAAELTRYMAPVVIFATITFTFVGLMQSYGHYVMSSAISIFSNAVVIVYLMTLNSNFGLVGLAVAFTIGWGVQAVVQMPMMAREGYIYKPQLNLRSSDMRDTIRMTGPVLFSTWAQPASAMIISILASYYSGGVALMEYANRVYIIISGVLVYTITNYVFPKLSKTFSQKNKKGFGHVIEKSLELFIYFGLPVVFITVLFSEEMIRVLFERGLFDRTATVRAGRILGVFIWGLMGLGFKEILNRVYFAMGNSRLPLWITLVGIGLNLPLSIGLGRLMGLEGLALGATLSMVFSSGIMLAISIRRGLIANWVEFIKRFLSILFVDTVLFYGLSRILPTLQYGTLKTVVIMGGITLAYFACHVGLLKILKVGIPSLQMESY